MARNVKRARGSNQYAEKIEAVPVEERRLSRKKKKGMSKSGAMMATPGKPFQCPSCGEVHPTGTMCMACQRKAGVGTFTCPGCRQAAIPSGSVLCESCESLTLQREPVYTGAPSPQQQFSQPQAQPWNQGGYSPYGLPQQAPAPHPQGGFPQQVPKRMPVQPAGPAPASSAPVRPADARPAESPQTGFRFTQPQEERGSRGLPSRRRPPNQ